MARAFAGAGSTGGRTARASPAARACRAGNPGGRQAVLALEPPDRCVGEHAITAIDRTRRSAGRRQAALQRTHNVLAAGLIACPRAQDEDWLTQRGPRSRTDDAVHLQAVRRLERNHRVSRTRSVESVHVPGRIAPPPRDRAAGLARAGNRRGCCSHSLKPALCGRGGRGRRAAVPRWPGWTRTSSAAQDPSPLRAPSPGRPERAR